MRKSLLAAAAACSLMGVTPAHAVVGGTNVPAGQHKAVAEITLGQLAGCSGTLIAPTWVMTAGHCGSLTGGLTPVAQPVANWPAEAIEVRLGSNKPGQGTVRPVAEVIVEPDYLLTTGYDITLLRLTSAVTDIAPVPVANAGERDVWAAGVNQTIVGWGLTEEDGSSPNTLQHAQVPITTDAYCEANYGGQQMGVFGNTGFENQTMVCAGYPAGGIDTCQGDSGGPMFGAVPATGALRLTGATSWGEGCAREDRPGVYARVADTALRTWIASVAPAAIAP